MLHGWWAAGALLPSWNGAGAGDTGGVLLWDAHFPPIMIMHLLTGY